MDGGPVPVCLKLYIPPTPSVTKPKALIASDNITTSICMNRMAGQLEGNIRNCVGGGRISGEGEGKIQGNSICDLSTVKYFLVVNFGNII